MPVHSIEARSFKIALAWCHNFWVLKDAGGATLAELHGLAWDRINRKILPIGTTRNHALRVFLFPHEDAYAQAVGLRTGSTRMYYRSRAHTVHRGEDALERWSAAVRAMPILDALDITYPPFGFNVRSATVNSNSAYRTFGEIMGIAVYDFPRAFRPGFANHMLDAAGLEGARYRPAGELRASR